MNASGLKILLPLALLMGIIFAVTYFSRYTPTDDTTPKAEQAASHEKPLVFFTSSRKWDPDPEASLADQRFQGFYEPNDQETRRAAFWFENPNKAPVSIQLRRVSCSACSSGRVASIPPDATRQILQMAAVGLLPQGLFAGLPAGMAGPAANLAALDWQEHKFNQEPSNVVYSVMAAENADGWSPQWGVLELGFVVRPNPSVPLMALFGSSVQGTEQVGQDEFRIFFEAAAAFDLDKTAIEVGTLSDATSTQTHEVLVYSTTRALDAARDLTVNILMPPGLSGEPGKFVTTGPPIPLTGSELATLARSMSAKRERPTRVRSAFRIPVTVQARVGDDRPDIGRFERDIWVSVANAPANESGKRVQVRGTVRGPVYLSEGTELRLQPFPYADGTSQVFEVTTERPDIELKVIGDQTHPAFLDVKLEKQQARKDSDRGYYKLRVTVPKNSQLGTISDGLVVLELQGKTPQRYRIPVTGRGTR